MNKRELVSLHLWKQRSFRFLLLLLVLPVLVLLLLRLPLLMPQKPKPNGVRCKGPPPKHKA